MSQNDPANGLENSSVPDHLLLAALEPLSRAEEWDFEMVKHGLRSATASVRHVVAASPRDANTEVEWLERAYGFLAAHTERRDYDRTPEFVLGRIAGLLELAEAAAPPWSEAEQDSLLDATNEYGRTNFKFLEVIAKGAKRPTDMAEYIPNRDDIYDRGFSTANRHLKHLMLGGYLIRERCGRDVTYRLSAAGLQALLMAKGDE